MRQAGGKDQIGFWCHQECVRQQPDENKEPPIQTLNLVVSVFLVLLLR